MKDNKIELVKFNLVGLLAEYTVAKGAKGIFCSGSLIDEIEFGKLEAANKTFLNVTQ